MATATAATTPSITDVSRWVWFLLFFLVSLFFLVPYLNEKQANKTSASKAAAAASSAEAARPKDYTELSLEGERLRVYRFNLNGANRSTGLLILDEQATDFRFDTVPDVAVDFMEYPDGKRISIATGEHRSDLKVTEGGRKQFFSLEAKGDCVVTFTVSVR